jgi:hypothetical protein
MGLREGVNEFIIAKSMFHVYLDVPLAEKLATQTNSRIMDSKS